MAEEDAAANDVDLFTCLMYAAEDAADGVNVRSQVFTVEATEDAVVVRVLESFLVSVEALEPLAETLFAIPRIIEMALELAADSALLVDLTMLDADGCVIVLTTPMLLNSAAEEAWLTDKETTLTLVARVDADEPMVPVIVFVTSLDVDVADDPDIDLIN